MAFDPTLKTKLADRFWRLNHLYFITDKHGRKIRFTMTAQQRAYFTGMHTRNLILKARQLGFTTEVCLIQLDAALFESAKCALIAHTLNDAKRLFREKVKYAYDHLPDLLKRANPARNDSAGELVFHNGGSLYISTSFRGGTLRYLHISEFGKLCAKFPEKAREIVTGAFEAVATDCVVTIESTAEGRAGYFFDYCQTAEKALLSNKPLGPLDWKFFFFSWWNNPQYALPVSSPLPPRLQAYFSELQTKQSIRLTAEQKAWYYAKESTLGDDMKREYPSIPSEAFQQSIEGAYYANQFRYLYENQRIGTLPANPHLPVHTFWDLGVGDATVIWFVREVGSEFHLMDYYENSGEGLRHYMQVLKARAYHYGEHWAPHDIDNRELAGDGKSRRQLAYEGYALDGDIYRINFKVVPRLRVDEGIESVREILPRCAFDSVTCEQGLSHLERYRKAWDNQYGCWKDKPLHDASSHAADAFRYFAVAKRNHRQLRGQVTPLRL
ncbi:terminase [Candidatus Fukatsuia endosymbiont of Tuberolachnus salignus]|uniref:terminase n=1 Tax=Candidatus Fukatsuia endosymbiont of Tuberolachnus salignus TaxID=3077957 RepID=UPI00313AA21D